MPLPAKNELRTMFWKQKMLLNKVSEGWDGMVISYQIEGSFEVFKKGKIILVTFSLGSSSKANFSFIV